MRLRRHPPRRTRHPGAHADAARSVGQDDDLNLAVLVDELAAIAVDAAAEGIGQTDTRDRQKVLIFSYYAVVCPGFRAVSLLDSGQLRAVVAWRPA